MIRSQCDPVRKHKIFYLMVSVDVPEQPSIEAKNIIEVDMGIVNVSVDSTGISTRTTVKKGNKYIHNSWAFYQFRLFIEYKAIEAGIPVIVIDPHNTSKECPNCHTISKKNRPERSTFKCISCGLKGEADYIASLNIRNRAVANQPIVAGDFFVHCDTLVASSLL